MFFQLMVTWWFGARWFGILGVARSKNPFHKGIPGMQTTNPNHQLSVSPLKKIKIALHCCTFEYIYIYSWLESEILELCFGGYYIHNSWWIDFHCFCWRKVPEGTEKSENDLRNKDWEKQIDFLYCRHKKQRQKEVKKHQRRGLLAVSVLVENPVVSKWFHVRFPSCHRVGIILELHLKRFIKWSRFIDSDWGCDKIPSTALFCHCPSRPKGTQPGDVQREWPQLTTFIQGSWKADICEQSEQKIQQKHH